jgi:ABC-type phosphate transport system permease subunit
MAIVRENVPAENFAIDLGSLEHSLRQPRSPFSYVKSFLTGAATIAAMVPLFSVLYLLIKRGLAGLNWAAFTDLPPAAMMEGGGFGNAIVGTLVIVAIATVISVPLGILGAVCIADFGADSKVAKAVQFAAKVLTGLPSILAGVFAFATVVVVNRRIFRARRRSGAGIADAADDHADGRRSHQASAVPNARGGNRDGRYSDPGRHQGDLADRISGDPDRSHAGARARRR